MGLRAYGLRLGVWGFGGLGVWGFGGLGVWGFGGLGVWRFGGFEVLGSKGLGFKGYSSGPPKPSCMLGISHAVTSPALNTEDLHFDKLGHALPTIPEKL